MTETTPTIPRGVLVWKGDTARSDARSAGRADASGGRSVNPFPALRHRNFRLFFFGQLISLAGTWMQRIAQAWLVLQLTNSPLLLGIVGALQWTPMLLLSLVGGVVADRVNKRNLLVVHPDGCRCCRRSGSGCWC